MGALETSFKRVSNKHFLIQSDLMLSTMLGILRSASGDVQDAMTLDIFLDLPLGFENKDFDTSVAITFASAASRPNINRLVLDKNASREEGVEPVVPLNPSFEAYLDHILTVYNVSDKILLASMIADAVDEDLDERVAGSELALDYPDFTQGHLYDIRHFEQLLEHYEAKTYDRAASAIPWDRLIGFHNDGIDFNHVTPEALQFLAPEIPVESLALFTTERLDLYETLEDLPFEAETKEKLKELNVVFYSPKVTGEIYIKNGERLLRVTFLYNLESKEVSDIEITQ